MNIDTKLQAFKSFLSENKLNHSGVKTTINHSAVSSGEQANVDLNMNSEEEKSGNGKSKKKKNNDLSFLEENNTETVEVKKNDTEIKIKFE